MHFHQFALFSQQFKRSCSRVARQSSAKASTAVRIRSGPHQWITFVVHFLFMKYSNYLGAISSLALIICCFLPWVHINSLDLTLNGFQGKISEQLDFGKQAYTHIFFASLMFVFFLLQKIWAKRINILIGAFQFSWAIKNYIVFSMCREGECPEKMIGIYLLISLSFLMLMFTLMPKLKSGFQN